MLKIKNNSNLILETFPEVTFILGSIFNHKLLSITENKLQNYLAFCTIIS